MSMLTHALGQGYVCALCLQLGAADGKEKERKGCSSSGQCL